jgi:hypothetical protein
MSHQVFISYATEDRAVADAVCAKLEAGGTRCWIAPRDIGAGKVWPGAIAKAIRESRALVLVLSRHSMARPYIPSELRLAFEGGCQILPLRVDDAELDDQFQFLVGGSHILDARRSLPEAIDRLALDLKVHLVQEASPAAEPKISAIPEPGPTPPLLRLVLAYKRNAQPDEVLVRRLEEEFLERGHEVFVDRNLKIGIEWAREIEGQIRRADALIPLLSAASTQSEMLTWEVQTAHDEAQRRDGKPRLFPVRVCYPGEAKLPPELAVILDRLQYFPWKDPQDDDRLIGELAEALRGPQPIKPPRRVPMGGLPLDSESYVARATDPSFHAALGRRDSIVLIRGARQMGKTSLLARGLHRARESGAAVAFVDFQTLNQSELASPDVFYKALGAALASELDLDVSPEDTWNSRYSPNTNFEKFVRREILDKQDRPLVWALDEVDRLFSCDFGSEVFGLFRSWHNARAMRPDSSWARLTMVIAYATEAHLFITDMNQSPFNVGTLIALEDFVPEQVADLNVRYESPLRTEAERSAFCGLVGGHPYLANRGLFEMAEQGMDLAGFAAQAEREGGLFNDHLRRILVLLARDPDLSNVLRGVLAGGACPESKGFYRLRAAGVLAGDSVRDARLRCRLYHTYLTRHLP